MKRLVCSLSIAVALLSSCKNASNDQAASAAECATSDLKIAYVNTDSLLNQYEYAKKVSDQLNSKAESARADFNQRARVFQQDVAEFQRKVQNNGFLSMERAQSEEARLKKTEQDLQELNQRLSNDLMQEQGRLTSELQDTIVGFLKVFAKDRYSLILSNNMGDNVLYAADGVDITSEVVAALNARYNASQKQ